MFKVNKYFDGKVVSISFDSEKGPATAGVMAAGEFEFSTTKREYMSITSGEMTVHLPDGAEDWKVFKAGDTFIVEKDQTFNVEITSDVSYVCVYE